MGIRSNLRQKDKELEQLCVERRHSTAATGEELRLLEPEENPSHLSLWQKIKLVAGGVCVGLVTFAITMVELEITFTERTTGQTHDMCCM